MKDVIFVLTSSGSSAIYNTAAAARVRYPVAERTVRARDTASVHNYDSFSISSAPTGDSRFQMDLVSRLSNEIRTATTTGDIQSLRRQVASGTYEVDPSAIAARMLFLAEV